MKHIKTYEGIFSKPNLNEFEPEVIKLYEYLKKMMKKMPSEFKNNTFHESISIEENKNDSPFADKRRKTYSIILNTYYYFVYQFDYKEDGMWIKYTCDSKMTDYLKQLETFFYAIAIKNSEWGWCFDRNEFMSADIDMYLNANKYNL